MNAPASSKPLAKTLICTVGTSLRSNLNRLDPEARDAPGQGERSTPARRERLDDPDRLPKTRQEIRRLHERKDWPRLGRSLAALPADERLLGAEINSIHAMEEKDFLAEDRERLVLLVSDTEDGRSTGNILQSYFLHESCPVGFPQCKVFVVEGLKDDDPPAFQSKGLPNLVRLLGDQLRRWGSVAINATGGYKAQIALAVAFGQTTGCPVYYKHERFNQIIAFPAVPFAMDLSLMGERLDFWADLSERGNLFTEAEMAARMGDAAYGEKVLPLLQTVEIDGAPYCELSPLGLVYWEAFLSRNPHAELAPAGAAEKKGCRFRDDHYPAGFKDFVRRVHDGNAFVTECHSLPYDGQKSIRPRGFFLREDGIVGHYADRDNFGARFRVLTTARNELQRKGALRRLDEWLEQRSSS